MPLHRNILTLIATAGLLPQEGTMLTKRILHLISDPYHAQIPILIR
jgi:hypothetical protein